MVFDINVTSICNLACTYCSEGESCGLSTEFQANTKIDPMKLYDLVDKLDDKEYKLFFWGGEPFVNWNYCKQIIDNYIDDQRFQFFFYTNGMYIERDIKELVEYKEKLGKHRLFIQVSYDGDPINGIVRIDKRGRSTSEKVKRGFLLLQEHGINSSLKSVISEENFDKMFEAYLDVTSINFNYNPTPDSFSQLTWEEFQKHIPGLESSLQKISKHIIDNNLKPETFAWFTISKALCKAGVNYTSIDLNGDILPCHGCMYRDNHDHLLGNINTITKDFPNIKEFFAKNSEAYDKGQFIKPECMACDALFCMKCPVGSYVKSTEEDYFSRWSDSTANWQNCQVFKIADKYHKAVRYSLQLKNKKA